MEVTVPLKEEVLYSWTEEGLVAVYRVSRRGTTVNAIFQREGGRGWGAGVWEWERHDGSKLLRAGYSILNYLPCPWQNLIHGLTF